MNCTSFCAARRQANSNVEPVWQKEDFWQDVERQTVLASVTADALVRILSLLLSHARTLLCGQLSCGGRAFPPPSALSNGGKGSELTPIYRAYLKNALYAPWCRFCMSVKAWCTALPCD